MAGFAAWTALGSAYVVRKGDTLSGLAAAHLGKPVYGERGSLRKLLGANARIQNPNFIRAGQEIDLPGERVAEHRDRELLSANRTPASEAGIPAPELSPPPLPSLPDAFASHGVVTLSPEFLSVKVTGGQGASGASLTSNSDFGGLLAYSQVWNPGLWSSLFFSFHKLSMNAPDAGGTLENLNPTLYSFGATISGGVTPRLSLGAGFGIFERFYLKATAASTVRLDPLSVPQVFVFGSYDFYRQNPFTLGARLGAAVDWAQNSNGYRTGMNPSGSGAVFIQHEAGEKLQTEIGLKAAYLVENTSIAAQSETDLGIYLNLSFSFGQAKK